MIRLIFEVKDKNTLVITVRDAGRVISIKTLTLGQGFDTMLIKALDKILVKNKIDRLSLKNVEIRGKTEQSALSGMMLAAVRTALSK